MLFGVVFGLKASIALGDTLLLVSVRDQKMAWLEDGVEKQRFPVSTSRFGVGDYEGSYATPLGALEVACKIGAALPEGAVFKGRKPTGEVLPVNAPGRDPIVTRILWLKGLEGRNAHSYGRCIYIHGTPEERTIGQPVSWGCIRMRSQDVVRVFDGVEVGTRVEITEQSIRKAVRALRGGMQVARVR